MRGGTDMVWLVVSRLMTVCLGGCKAAFLNSTGTQMSTVIGEAERAIGEITLIPHDYIELL